MASSTRTCARCGNVVVDTARLGLCPFCLFESALGEILPGDVEAAESGSTSASRGSELSRLPEPPFQLRYFGDYELIGELARGGMGIVYLARQTSLDRLVAVKLLLYGGFSSPAFVERFRSEAAAAARLQHPGIVGVYEIGEHGGHRFFSMEYVRGENLAQRTSRLPPVPVQAAEILRNVAEAVQFAHQQGILHRDLKPANILLDLNGRVRVLDFGLAKRLDRVSELTNTGEVLGSPSFMAPEQALGGSESVGTAADVYGLGAVLYYLLTGRPPFQAATLTATLELVVRGEPVSPRSLNPSVTSDLETICLKCLAKTPSERYVTAADLAADLGRFLRDEPILARPVHGLERLWRWSRRRPALAGLIGATLAFALTLALGGLEYGWQQERARAREEAFRAEADRKSYALSLNLAERARSEGDHQQADRLLSGVIPRPSEPDLRGFEWYHLRHELRDREVRRIWSSTNEVLGLAASPQGDILAALFAQELRLLSVQDGTTVASWSIPEDTIQRNMLFTGDGSGVILGSVTGAIIYQRDKAPRTVLTEPANVLALSGDGVRLAFSHTDPTQDLESELGFGVLDLRTDRVLDRQERNGGPGLAWIATAQGDWELLVLGSRSQLTRWRLGDVPVPIWGRSHFTDFAGFTPDAKQVVYDDLRGFLVWSSTTNTPLDTVLDSGASRRRVPWSVTRPIMAFSADGTYVVLKNGADQRIVVCDAKTGMVIQRYAGHRGEITGLASLGATSLLASSSRDGTIRLWDTQKRFENFLLTNDLARFKLPAPLFSSDSSLLVLPTFYRSPKAFFSAISVPEFIVSSREEGLPISFFSGDSRLLLWQRNGYFSVWNRLANRPDTYLDVLGRHKEDWSHLTSDGSYLFVEEASSVLKCLDFRADGSAIMIGTNIAFITRTPTGNGFAAMTEEGVCYWKSPVAQRRRILDRDARALAFSCTGDILAAGDIVGTVTLVDVSTGNILRELNGHRGEVNTIAISPDGRSLVSGAEDRTLRFWSVATGAPLFVRAMPENVHWLSFSPNGRWLVVGWEGAFEFLEAPGAFGGLVRPGGHHFWTNILRLQSNRSGRTP